MKQKTFNFKKVTLYVYKTKKLATNNFANQTEPTTSILTTTITSSMFNK